MIVIARTYLPDQLGTFGKLTLDGEHVCYTLEPPWRDNRENESCIPEGDYRLHTRKSRVVKRSSGGEFKEGWEIVGVEGRTFVMFHPGNWVKDTDGCPLTGEAFSWHRNLGPMVTNSRDTFRRFMKAMEEKPSWMLTIEQIQP